MPEWAKMVLQFLSVPLASMVTYLVVRKKNTAETRKVQAEAQGSELENVNTIIKFWKTMVDDLGKEMNDLKRELIEFTTENKALKKEVNGYRRENEELRQQNENLEKRMVKMQDEIALLRRDHK